MIKKKDVICYDQMVVSRIVLDPDQIFWAVLEVRINGYYCIRMGSGGQLEIKPLDWLSSCRSVGLCSALTHDYLRGFLKHLDRMRSKNVFIRAQKLIDVNSFTIKKIMK